jgi:tellurite resistance protein
MSLTRFASERGLITMYDVRSHIHAGLRSAPQTKTYQRWNERETARLMAASAETEAAYRAAVASGEISVPEKATLEEIAAGDPELASTQAAIRCLQKRAEREAQRA